MTICIMLAILLWILGAAVAARKSRFRMRHFAGVFIFPLLRLALCHVDGALYGFMWVCRVAECARPRSCSSGWPERLRCVCAVRVRLPTVNAASRPTRYCTRDARALRDGDAKER